MLIKYRVVLAKIGSERVNVFSGTGSPARVVLVLTRPKKNLRYIQCVPKKVATFLFFE